MDFAELAEHIRDSDRFHFPLGKSWVIPKVLGFQVTKFMVLELIAAALMLLIFLTLGQADSRRRSAQGAVLELL